MERPPAYDLADPWDKLKDQDGDLTFKGSQGVREYFARKGIDMTKKEAAKELGVIKATVDTYLSAGKLKGDGQGGVDDESVKAYKRKREENMKKTKIAGVAHKEEFVAEPKHIDSYSKDDPDHAEYIVTKGELMEAFRIAKEMGYKEGYAACKKEQHRERLTKKELLQLIA